MGNRDSWPRYVDPPTPIAWKNIANRFVFLLSQGISDILLQGVQFPFYCGKAMLESKQAF